MKHLLLKQPYKARFGQAISGFFMPLLKKIIADSVPTMQFFFLQIQIFVHGLAQQTSSWQLVS